MYISVRRRLGLVLGVLALLGPLNAKGQAQYAFGGLGFNPYANSLVGGGLYGFGGGLSGSLGYGSQLIGGSGGLGLYGGISSGLLSSAITGAGYASGYGSSSTQWMMNPYQGYLQGAADLTRSNAQYWQTIQQARMARQQSIRSSLETRRAIIEEVEWERAHMPDPEKIRRHALERELSAARVNPPANDIWSGRAQNTLLRHLITQLGEGVREPLVPITEDIAKHINVKVGDSIGNVALLKNEGVLEWPQLLQRSTFKESRELLNTLMHRAYRSVDSGNNPDPTTLNNLLAQFRKLRDTLGSNASKLTPDEYIEGQRYLTEVGQAIKGLQDPNVGRQFSNDWKPTQVRSVAELVKHMRDKGQMFAPASKRDTAAYVALYHALAAYDADLGRVVASTRGNPDAGDNK